MSEDVGGVYSECFVMPATPVVDLSDKRADIGSARVCFDCLIGIRILQVSVVPLSAPFTVEIESKGYKPWKFRTQAQQETVALNKGESKHLSVKLRKLDQ